MELNVYKIDGSDSGVKVTLNDSIFNIDPSDAAIYHDIMSFRTRQRQGTNMAKNRALVNGGGKKPYRQKGTGRARAGTSRSPIWVGGGKIFPPEPIDYKYKISKKEKALARKSAYAYKARGEMITVVEDFELKEIKTKTVAGILQNLQSREVKVLLVTPDHDKNVYMSARNLPKVNVKSLTDVSTYDLVYADKLIFEKSALEKLNQG